MGRALGAAVGVGVFVLTAGVAAASTPAAASCPHPYFPISEGLTLTYRAGKSEVQVRFSDVRQDGDKTKGLLHLLHKGRDGSTEATCSDYGIETQLGGIEGAALSMSGMDVHIVSSSGIAMPPPDEMVEGAKWANMMKIELRPPKKSGLAFGLVRTTFKKISTIEARETIEVAGQSWEALRVRNEITAMAGTAGERTLQSTMWLAPEVGILKIQTGNSVDFELLKVERPDEVKNVARPEIEAVDLEKTGGAKGVR